MKKQSNIQIVVSVITAVILLAISFQIGDVNANLLRVQEKIDNLEVGNAPSDNVKAPTIKTTPQAVAIDASLTGGNAVKGDPDAPITIVEWSDFQCPYCSRFYEQTLPIIEEKYIKTGKVNFVFRDFPLSFHNNAQKAAEAAECAGEQGEYYEMHNLLFENSRDLSVSNYKKWAVDLGLDTKEFNECLDSGKMAAEVKADMDAGAAQGIRGTPGFIVNGKLISGAQPFEVFEAAIEEALA